MARNLRGGVDWVIILLPGEEHPAELIDELLGSIDTVAFAVTREERSPSGCRQTSAIRAWQPQAVRQVSAFPDGPIVVTGPVMDIVSVGSFDRTAWSQAPQAAVVGGTVSPKAALTGLAEACEVNGDWFGAAERWALLGEGQGPWPAYGRMRAALAIGALRPSSERARRGLLDALDACPALPEAALRLAGWHAGRGDVDAAIAWAAMADSVPRPAAGLPHLAGTGSWAVPAQMAIWLATAAPSLATKCAQMASCRTPPSNVMNKVSELTGGVKPVNGDLAKGLQEAFHLAQYE